MQETERSLRMYFVLAGAIAIVLALRDVSVWTKLRDELPLDWKIAIYLPVISRLVLGVAFIIAGIQLTKALVHGATWIKRLLIASGITFIVSGALVTSVLGTVEGQPGLVGAGISLAITVYLYRSVVRLSDEARARAGIPPAPPTAKIV